MKNSSNNNNNSNQWSLNSNNNQNQNQNNAWPTNNNNKNTNFGNNGMQHGSVIGGHNANPYGIDVLEGIRLISDPQFNASSIKAKYAPGAASFPTLNNNLTNIRNNNNSNDNNNGSKRRTSLSLTPNARKSVNNLAAKRGNLVSKMTEKYVNNVNLHLSPSLFDNQSNVSYYQSSANNIGLSPSIRKQNLEANSRFGYSSNNNNNNYSNEGRFDSALSGYATLVTGERHGSRRSDFVKNGLKMNGNSASKRYQTERRSNSMDGIRNISTLHDISDANNSLLANNASLLKDCMYIFFLFSIVTV